MQDYYKRKDGSFIHYEKIDGQGEGILYLHGLLSSKESKKGQFLKQLAIKMGRPYLSLDFNCHGKSSGKPNELTIGQCLKDACDILNDVATDKNYIVVGSSLGGWIACLLARKLPNRVSALIGLAPGVDFTQWVWNDMLSEEQQNFLKNGGVLGPSEETNGYCFTYRFFQEAENHFLRKNETTISYTGPVVLINGDKDVLVDFKKTLSLIDNFESDDVKILIVKGADHRLSTETDLSVIQNVVDTILKKINDR